MKTFLCCLLAAAAALDAPAAKPMRPYRVDTEGGKRDYGTALVAVFEDGSTAPLYASGSGPLMTREELAAAYPRGTWSMGITGKQETFSGNSSVMAETDSGVAWAAPGDVYGRAIYVFPRPEW